jgi:hypothetical protein
MSKNKAGEKAREYKSWRKFAADYLDSNIR